MAEQPGVSETGAVFDAPVRDRWTIARERLAEYRRTGETISIEEAMAELDRLIAERRAAKVLRIFHSLEERALTDTTEEAGWATAKTLAEALPYIQIYDRETVVIKYGGHAMGEDSVAKLFAADAVHDDRAGVKSTFVDGLRVTDEATK
eukprot:gene59643-81615_t